MSSEAELSLTDMMAVIKEVYPEASPRSPDRDHDGYWISSGVLDNQVVDLSLHEDSRGDGTHNTIEGAWRMAYKNTMKGRGVLKEEKRDSKPASVNKCPYCGIEKLEYGGAGFNLHLVRCKQWQDDVKKEEPRQKGCQPPQGMFTPVDASAMSKTRVQEKYKGAISLSRVNPKDCQSVEYHIRDVGRGGMELSGWHPNTAAAWDDAWKKVQKEDADSKGACDARIAWLVGCVRKIFPSAKCLEMGSGFKIACDDSKNLSSVWPNEIDAWEEAQKLIEEGVVKPPVKPLLRPELTREQRQWCLQEALKVTDKSPPLVGSVEIPKSLKALQHGGNHYKKLKIQPAYYCHINHLRFCESEAIKYLSRFRDKNGTVDVKKAIHFCQMILDFEFGVQSTVVYSDEKREVQTEKKLDQIQEGL